MHKLIKSQQFNIQKMVFLIFGLRIIRSARPVLTFYPDQSN